MLRSQQRQQQYMADINIIPFVDVALVLLVIFMVTAPMLYRGFDLTLPESKTDSTYKPQDPIVISIEKDDVIYFGEDQVDLEAFPVWLRDAKDDNP
ncbi:MAG TPA: biopolymer transporter ExbD, partial [Nitrospirales bacterium]|nr:biopolymer transporter ExbD [Nitrospirales bacterium]